LSKDNKNVEDNNIGKSVPSEVSDISDDVSVMSEFILDDPDNTVATTNTLAVATTNTLAVATTNTLAVATTKPKPTRGRKKKN
jgi:hypothetical protein